MRIGAPRSCSNSAASSSSSCSALGNSLEGGFTTSSLGPTSGGIIFDDAGGCTDDEGWGANAGCASDEADVEADVEARGAIGRSTDDVEARGAMGRASTDDGGGATTTDTFAVNGFAPAKRDGGAALAFFAAASRRRRRSSRMARSFICWIPASAAMV